MAEITDATRLANVQGDGRASPDSSFGFWDAATNVLVNGGFETNTTSWTQVSATLTRSTSQFKFGVASGNIVTSNATANEGAFQNFTASVTAYTVSAWVRGAGGGTVRMAVRDNAGANPQTGAAVTLTSAWQRITLTTTNLTVATWRCYVETDVQQSITFQIDGVQAEFKDYATPYVETNGGTATRAIARVQAPAGLLTQTQFWVVARTRMGVSSNATTESWFAFQWRNPTGNSDGYQIRYRNGLNNWRVEQTVGGVDHAATISDTFVPGDMRTIIGRYAPTLMGVSVNGSVFTTTVLASTPTVTPTLFDIGSDPLFGHLALNGDILWYAIGVGTLTDADAATIHGFGNTDPKAEQFPASSLVQMVWHANDNQSRIGHQETLTLSGNEITDVVRTTNTQGDGQTAPDSSMGIWEGTTNLITNGGFESNTTGWSGAGITLTSSTDRGKFGSRSGKCLVTGTVGNQGITYAITLTAAVHSAFAWFYVPTAFDGSAITLRFDSFAGATGTTAVNANLSLRDQWQRVVVPNYTIAGGDLVGNIQVLADSPSGTGVFYVDGVQVEQKSVATPYVETNGATASRSAARVQLPVGKLFTPSQGWFAARMRMGWDTTNGFASTVPGFFAWTQDGNNSLKLLALNKTTARLQVRNGGIQDQIDLAFPAFNINDLLTVVAYWTTVTGNIKLGLSFNGAAFTTNQTIIAPPSLPITLFDLFTDAAGREIDSTALWAACGSGTLVNADATTINGFGSTDKLPTDFPGSCTGVWWANTATFYQA